MHTKNNLKIYSLNTEMREFKLGSNDINSKPIEI